MQCDETFSKQSETTETIFCFLALLLLFLPEVKKKK